MSDFGPSRGLFTWQRIHSVSESQINKPNITKTHLPATKVATVIAAARTLGLQLKRSLMHRESEPRREEHLRPELLLVPRLRVAF